jgi:hypothetical protein
MTDHVKASSGYAKVKSQMHKQTTNKLRISTLVVRPVHVPIDESASRHKAVLPAAIKCRLLDENANAHRLFARRILEISTFDMTT